MTSNDKIIIPTIGRRVWFWPARNAGQAGFISHDAGTPMDAGVVYVWGDRMVNLDVTDHAGNHHAFTSVTLAQPVDEPPQDGRYCQWMPYQVGQAKAPVVTTAAAPAPQQDASTLFRKKPVVVTAITFDQLLDHGRTWLREKLQALGPNGMPWHFEYGGRHISHEHDDTYLIPTPEGTMQMGPNDMLITGVAGEIYPCKREIFDATYDRASAPVIVEAPREATLRGIAESLGLPLDSDLMTFGAALERVKAGARVARAGWNGKGQFAYLVPAASYPVQTGAAAAHFGAGSVVPYRAYLALKTVDDTVSTWAPSVSDVLAEDWLVLP